MGIRDQLRGLTQSAQADQAALRAELPAALEVDTLVPGEPATPVAPNVYEESESELSNRLTEKYHPTWTAAPLYAARRSRLEEIADLEWAADKLRSGIENARNRTDVRRIERQIERREAEAAQLQRTLNPAGPDGQPMLIACKYSMAGCDELLPISDAPLLNEMCALCFDARVNGRRRVWRWQLDPNVPGPPALGSPW